MLFDVISLFPELIESSFKKGISGRALKNSMITLRTWNPRDFSESTKGRVDDRPYGGGPGMVMLADPLIKAIRRAKEKSKKPYVIYMSPQGKLFTQSKAKEFSKREHLVIVCGRYEGIDQRVLDTEVDEECSIGEFIVSGGEVPALLLMDSVSRVIEGVLGDPRSVSKDTFSNGILKHPQYTRPESCTYGDVPTVLLSGNHREIKKWQLKQSLAKTKKNRPDLLKSKDFSEVEKDLLGEIVREEKNKSDRMGAPKSSEIKNSIEQE